MTIYNRGINLGETDINCNDMRYALVYVPAYIRMYDISNTNT